MSDTPSPFLSAKRANERVQHLVQYYRQQLNFYLRAFTSDGYVVGTEPQSREERYLETAARFPELMQESMQGPQARRERAQKQLMDAERIGRDAAE